MEGQQASVQQARHQEDYQGQAAYHHQGTPAGYQYFGSYGPTMMGDQGYQGHPVQQHQAAPVVVPSAGGPWGYVGCPQQGVPNGPMMPSGVHQVVPGPGQGFTMFPPTVAVNNAYNNQPYVQGQPPSTAQHYSYEYAYVTEQPNYMLQIQQQQQQQQQLAAMRQQQLQLQQNPYFASLMAAQAAVPKPIGAPNARWVSPQPPRPSPENNPGNQSVRPFNLPQQPQQEPPRGPRPSDA
jgi:hypothetical protein